MWGLSTCTQVSKTCILVNDKVSDMEWFYWTWSSYSTGSTTSVGGWCCYWLDSCTRRPGKWKQDWNPIEGGGKGKGGMWKGQMSGGENGRWSKHEGGDEGRKQAFKNGEGKDTIKKRGGRSQNQGFSKSHKYITNHTLPFSRRACLTQVHKHETCTRPLDKPFFALYKEKRSNFVTN